MYRFTVDWTNLQFFGQLHKFTVHQKNLQFFKRLHIFTIYRIVVEHIYILKIFERIYNNKSKCITTTNLNLIHYITI